MRSTRFAPAIALWLLVAAAFAQDQAPPQLLVRFQKVNTFQEMDATGGGQVRSNNMQSVTTHYPTDSMCILVYGDGSYYYEQMNERNIGKPKIKAFKGTLSPADLQQLQSITGEPGFRQISSPPAPAEPVDATYLKEGEVVTIDVAHQDGNQQFHLVHKRFATRSAMNGMDTIVTNWSSLEKTLKPFLSWVKNIQKTSKTTDVKASGCPAGVAVN